MATLGLAPGLSRKLKKVLECRTDTPDMVSSLDALSTFYSENTPQSRRNLRSTIEKRSLHINNQFLQASGAAQQALDRVEEEVDALAECCDKYVFLLFSYSSLLLKLHFKLELVSKRVHYCVPVHSSINVESLVILLLF